MANHMLVPPPGSDTFVDPTYFAEGNTDRASLRAFARELVSKMPDLKFFRDTNRSYGVFFEGDIFCMGSIGFGDYTTSDNAAGDSKFMVYSRNICNTRYGKSYDQYHMKTTGAIDIAVRNALRHLRRYTQAECARAMYPEVREVLQDTFRDVSRDLDKKCDAFAGAGKYSLTEFLASPLFKELRVMDTDSYPFLDPSSGAAIRDILATERLKSELSQKEVLFNFVRVVDKRGEPYVDVSPIRIAFDKHIAHDWDNVTTTEYSVNRGEIPEETQGALAVLQMCEKNQYIEGVGVKMSEGAYYVVAEQ